MAPRVPSPELAARIQRWIDESDGGLHLGNWPRRVLKEKNALLIAANQAYFWGLQPGGGILHLDNDRFDQATETETDPRSIYAALAYAAETGYPELRELLPEQPANVKRCPNCGGTGRPPEPADLCNCGGLGWWLLCQDPPSGGDVPT